MAKDYMKANVARVGTRTLIPALARIGRLSAVPRSVDGARFQQHLGIAGLFVTVGVL